MSAQSDSRTSAMFGPWRLIRFILRVVLFGTLAWIVLALLWAFLPSPSTGQDGDPVPDQATSGLLSGDVLTRVYDSNHFIPHLQRNRQGFAIDYKLNIEDATLTIISPGSEETLSLFGGPEVTGLTPWTSTYNTEVNARFGDEDGANLPWFPFADAVLLYWHIHKDTLPVPLTVDWIEVIEANKRNTRLRSIDIKATGSGADPLLQLTMERNDTSTLQVHTPIKPLSSSPTKTYPIRVAIIYVIAPTAIFVNDFLGNAVGALISTLVNVIAVLFVVGLYVFLGVAVVVSCFRCLGRGPSIEGTYESLQDRLDILAENERLRFLRIEAVQDRLASMYCSNAFKRTVRICRNGWHPEMEAAERASEEEVDVETAKSST